MADLTPNCCDTKLELLTKILLQFQTMTTVVPPTAISASLLPSPTDDSWDLYRKILLTLALI